MDFTSEQLKIAAQKCFNSVPVIVIGSGYSAGYGFPTMGQLVDYLVKNIVPSHGEEAAQWEEFKKMAPNQGFEQSLQNIGNLNTNLLDKIISQTWICISEIDSKLKTAVIENPSSISLYRLIDFLFSSSSSSISVVTTNYDRICEYTAGVYGAICGTGFLPGVIGSGEDQRPLSYLRSGANARVVRLWKVHGSVDWFLVNGNIFRADLSTVTEGVVPQIITPGLEKYRRAFREPFRTVLAGADHALTHANSFFCIGYGFNDDHIQEKLVNRVIKQRKPICILTKQLTNSTKSFLNVLKDVEYVAVEECPGGSKVYTKAFPNGVAVADEKIWDLGGFLTWAFNK